MLRDALLQFFFRRAYPVAMPMALPYYTAEMVRAMPEDGNRYEVVHGELFVSPSPARPHQRVVTETIVRLVEYCRRFHLGEALVSPADISWSPDTLVQPDVFVIAPSESGGADWTTVRTLRLVVEVLSPSTSRNDRFAKRKLYQAQGVETLWLVDIERRLVEVWRPDALFPQVETERIAWHPAEAGEPLVIELGGLFR